MSRRKGRARKARRRLCCAPPWPQRPTPRRNANDKSSEEKAYRDDLLNSRNARPPGAPGSPSGARGARWPCEGGKSRGLRGRPNSSCALGRRRCSPPKLHGRRSSRPRRRSLRGSAAAAFFDRCQVRRGLLRRLLERREHRLHLVRLLLVRIVDPLPHLRVIYLRDRRRAEA